VEEDLSINSPSLPLPILLLPILVPSSVRKENLFEELGCFCEKKRFFQKMQKKA
jgi:hypothetical protein